MYKQFVILLLILSSCSSTRKLVDNNKMDTMNLDFLHTHQTSIDTIGDKIVISYRNLGLKEEQTEKKFVLLLKDDTVFIGNRDKYQYLFEVFKGTHLLISIVKGSSVAAGPDLFERNNVVILDLKEATMKRINLSNIYLTRSKEFLLKAYPIQNKGALEKQSFKYCAIDSIDLQNSKLLLLDQSNNIKEYRLENILKPFRCQ